MESVFFNQTPHAACGLELRSTRLEAHFLINISPSLLNHRSVVECQFRWQDYDSCEFLAVLDGLGVYLVIKISDEFVRGLRISFCLGLVLLKD
jgi:hypothetical protein